MKMFGFAKLIRLIGVAAPVGLCLFAYHSGFGSAVEEGNPSSGMFVGSTGCRDCHAEFYDKWSTSHHGLAMQPYSETFARHALESQTTPVAIGQVTYRADIERRHAVEEEGPDGRKHYPITHVMGGKNVYYFLTELERGRLQVLPVAFDVHKKNWFDTAASGVRHFPSGADEPVPWTDRAYTFNTACYRCHVSQSSSIYDFESDAYHTTWNEPGINCEACHGPARDHVRLFQTLPPGETPTDIQIISTQNFTTEQINHLCATCHAKAASLGTEFTPGDRFFDHYDLTLLEHPDYYPDGRDLGENYTYTSWLASPCAKSGRLDCLHCHTSSGRYRFNESNANHSCLPCHQERVENAVAHTHHPEGSAGNKCVSCHMPMTTFAHMNRTDHSMRPPAPSATLAFQSPNACNLCHTDQPVEWADRWVREWRPRDFQAAVLARGALIDAARKHNWSRLSEMLNFVKDKEHDEVDRASMVRLLRECAKNDKWPVLIEALDDPSPLVRAGAADALSPWITDASLPGLVKTLRDEYRLARIRAAAVLAGIPQSMLSPDDRVRLEQATAEYIDSLRARPDHWSSHYNLGNFYMSENQPQPAIDAFERARRLDPRNPLILTNLSIAYSMAGRNDRAFECLRGALKADPENAPAMFNLGLLHAEEGNRAEAERYLRDAFRFDPTLAPAAYNLAILVSSHNLDDTIHFCRVAYELDPGNPDYGYTLAYFLAERGNREEAVSVLETLLRDHPDRQDASNLLRSLLSR